MNAISRKAAVTVGTMAAALTLSLAGAGAAQADSKPLPAIPALGTVYGSLHECLTVGNTFAQRGQIVTFDCQPAGGGAYRFYWTA